MIQTINYNNGAIVVLKSVDGSTSVSAWHGAALLGTNYATIAAAKAAITRRRALLQRIYGAELVALYN